jgi:hypothetical protein
MTTCVVELSRAAARIDKVKVKRQKEKENKKIEKVKK